MKRLIPAGKALRKNSKEIAFSRIGIGFEKLDRELFDPEKAYPFVRDLGVKWVRLQSGWQRTEKSRGVYDFTWLDGIVDTFLDMGIEPWLCLCYGNSLYTEEAKKYFGAVGCAPVRTEKERSAWCAYVFACVAHFRGRIRFYEVWNEPDGQWCWKNGPDAEELAAFTRITAAACRRADPSCKVLGPVLCRGDGSFFQALKKTDILDHLDGITYHAYLVEEAEWTAREKLYEDWAKESGHPEMLIIQGESGTQSVRSFAGALKGACWTPEKQTKFLLRHLLCDLKNHVFFTSYFSSMDMAEALNGLVADEASWHDYGYFGVIGAEFDENGRATGNYYAKPSYYALQTLCSVFSDEYEVVDPPVRGKILPSPYVCGADCDFGKATSIGFARPDGSVAVAYWMPSNILTETYEGTASLEVDGSLLAKGVRITDLRDGSVYKLPEEMISDGVLRNIPITDSPLLLTFGEFCS